MSKDKTHNFMVRESRIRELAGHCPEYFEAMNILFPEAFEEEEDITMDMEWKLCPGADGFFLEGFYGGEQIAYVNPTHFYESKKVGIRILSDNPYKVKHGGGHTFKILKK